MRKILSFLLCLCLTVSLLSVTVFAEHLHTCIDENNNNHCDICYNLMGTFPHDCYARDDAYCDLCNQYISHQCLPMGYMPRCWFCGETTPHICEYSPGSYRCNLCEEYMPHSCTDENMNYQCDICWEPMPHNCFNEAGNRICQICYDLIPHNCFDTNGDYRCDFCDCSTLHEFVNQNQDRNCDLCGFPLSHECVDTNGDHYCERCGNSVSYYYGIQGTVTSGPGDGAVLVEVLDKMPAVFVPYVSFALFTGSSAEYKLDTFDETFTLRVSKPGYVTRSFAIDSADPVTLDVTLCPIGDASGDGKLTVNDTSRIYAHIKGSSTLSDEYALECADVTGDGKVNIVDVAKVYSHVKGTSQLW